MTANGLSEKKNSILEINDLCFAYPEEKKRALNHVSLHVEDGEFLVLCGKSGCGKRVSTAASITWVKEK